LNFAGLSDYVACRGPSFLHYVFANWIGVTAGRYVSSLSPSAGRDSFLSVWCDPLTNRFWQLGDGRACLCLRGIAVCIVAYLLCRCFKTAAMAVDGGLLRSSFASVQRGARGIGGIGARRYWWALRSKATPGLRPYVWGTFVAVVGGQGDFRSPRH